MALIKTTRTLAAALLVLAFLVLSGSGADAAQPEVISIVPGDGAVLSEPPKSVRMCFARPVNIKDLDKGGDFSFKVATPEGRGLGLRIVFQPDGLGVEVQPGIPRPAPEGEWTFDWRVTDPETLEPASGTVKFTVRPDGSPLPEPAPVPCGASYTPGATGDPTTVENDDDDGASALVVAVIVALALAGAAVLAAGVVRLRRRR